MKIISTELLSTNTLNNDESITEVKIIYEKDGIKRWFVCPVQKELSYKHKIRLATIFLEMQVEATDNVIVDKTDIRQKELDEIYKALKTTLENNLNQNE